MTNNLHFGVAVGIDRYPEFKDLTLARRDAREFAKWLRKPSGGNLPKRNVKLIVASDEEMPDDVTREDAVPVRARVYAAIQKYWRTVKAHVDENPADWFKTRLYFYVSGHGIGPSTQDVALLMADAGPDDYGENISCRELMHYLGEAQYFSEVVIFADCCRDRAPNAPLGKPPWTISRRDYGEVKTALGVAADFGGQAHEPDTEGQIDPDKFRGYYTQALLEGLDGQGQDAEINTKSLAHYIGERVKELLHGSGKSQRCHLYADLNNPIVFLRRPPITPSFVIVFNTDFRGMAGLLDGDGEEIERRQIDGEGTRWPVSLTKGLYRVVAVSGNGAGFKNDGYFAVVGGEDVVL